MKTTIAPSTTSNIPITSEAKVMFFTFHVFGLLVCFTLSVANDIVTKSFANTSRTMPNREITASCQPKEAKG